MSRLYALLFLLAASSQASDILRRRPDPKSAPVTIAGREAVASPIVTVPTIILGPSSEYMQIPVRIPLELCEFSTVQFQTTDSLQKSTATVTGSAVTIVEAAQKTDGVDIYFGPDAWKSIEAAGRKNCNTPTSPNCVSGLQSAISPPGFRLQARGPVSLVLAAVAALVAVVIGNFPSLHRWAASHTCSIPCPDADLVCTRFKHGSLCHGKRRSECNHCHKYSDARATTKVSKRRPMIPIHLSLKTEYADCK
jgi:hypothetical protein